MRPASGGNIIVRIVADDMWIRLSRHLFEPGMMVAAAVVLDLPESIDVRTRRAGAGLLATLQ